MHIRTTTYSSGLAMLIACLISWNSYAQIQFVNPSFEGPPGTGQTPAPWTLCGSGTPDTGPMTYNTMPASHGNSFIGVWNGSVVLATGEGTTQKLTCPLIAGKTYTFEIDITGYSGSYSPGNLCIYGGTSSNCSLTAADLLWRSNQAGQTAPGPAMSWKTYTVVLKPTVNYTFLTFWSCDASAAGNQYVSFDNIKPLTQDATFTFNNATCSTGGSASLTPFQTPMSYNYTWKDSTGAVISTNKININNLPPGTYTVTAIDPAEGACGIAIVKTFNISGPSQVSGVLTVDKDSVCGPGIVQFDFTPTVGGTVYNYSWTGAVSNSSIKNPTANVGSTTTYTLTVTSPVDASCNKQFTKTIVYTAPPNAGNSGSLALCSNSAPVDLFTKLGPAATTGGNWFNPTNSSFTNPFNPSIHSAGIYTYLVSAVGCPGDTAKLTITINSPVSAGQDGSLTICANDANPTLFDVVTNEPPNGRWSGGPGINSTSGLLNLAGITPGTYNYNYIISGTAPCLNDTSVASVTIKSIPIGTFGSVPPFCKGTSSKIPLNIQGTAPFTISYQEGSNSYTLNGISNTDSITISPSTNITYTLTSITDGGTPACTNNTTNSVNVILQLPPVLSIDSIECNSTSTTYRVFMNLAGGNSGTYTINGFPVTGPKYVSPPQNSGSSFNYQLTDRNNCAPFSTISGIKICDCVTDAGTMDPFLITSCGSVPANANARNDAYADPNDAINFVLHDAPGRSLGNIFAVKKNSSTFYFDSIPNLQRNIRYYISRIIGDPTSGDPLLVDLTNPTGCLSVSSGQPVIFNETPQLTANFKQNRICLGDTGIMQFNFTAGLEFFKLTFADGTILTGKSPLNNLYAVIPTVAGNINYQITQVRDTNGCINNVSIPLVLIVDDFPDTTNVQITCNSNYSDYQVSFSIINGDVNSYKVNNINTSSIYTSPFIPSGGSYDLRLNDDRQCKTIAVIGSYTCPCISSAGTMVAGPTSPIQDICLNNIASATHNNDYVFDGNDVLSYLLCTDPNNPLSTWVQHGSSPAFSFVAGMTANTVYYICPIVGDNDGTGIVDLTALCKSTSAGSPVRFINLPTVAITGNKDLCQGASTQILATVTGNGTIKFVLRGSDGSTQNVSGTGTFPITVTPSFSTGVVQYSIDPGIFDSTNPTNCSGTWISAPVNIIMHPTPTATISGSFVICLGETIKLNLALTGDDSLTAKFSSSTYSGTVKELAGNYNPAVTPATVGTHSYGITSVVDNTPSTCPGTFSGTATVEVRPIPSATLSLIDADVCRGETSGPRFDLAGYPNFTLYYRDSQAKKYTQTGLPVGVSSFPFVPTQTLTYFLDSITDGTLSDASNKSCFRSYVNAPSPNLMTVHQLPVGVLSGNNQICSGESTALTFNFTGSPLNSPQFTAVYSVYNHVLATTQIDSIITNNFIDSTLVSPSDTTTYSLLKVTDQFGCVDISPKGTAYVPVNPIPVPIIAASDSASCPPLVTTLLNLTDPKFLGAYVWHFGDGTTFSGSGAGSGVNHNYFDAGSYTVRLEVTSNQGCYKDSVISNFLTVHPLPVAQFTWGPLPLTILEPNVQFTNLSVLAETSNWTYFDQFGNPLQTSTVNNPRYLFPDQDSGSYVVKLVIASKYQCIDSISYLIKIDGDFNVYVPNSFTPNGDGVNDTFYPKTFGEQPSIFEFSIFNRWGERLFYSTSIDEGWDGTYKGERCQQGVYVYVIKTGSRYNIDLRTLSGHIRLIR